MSLYKTSGFAIFAAVCLLGETAGSAHAQFFATEWSGGKVINLGPGCCHQHQRRWAGGGERPWRRHRVERR